MVNEVIPLGTTKVGQRLYTDETGRVFFVLHMDGQGNITTNAAGFSYAHINATTLVSSVSGYLHAITVNGGTLGNITVYDNKAASGQIIAALDTLNKQTYIYDVKFMKGLMIVLAAATDITISFTVDSGSGLIQLAFTEALRVAEKFTHTP